MYEGLPTPHTSSPWLVTVEPAGPSADAVRVLLAQHTERARKHAEDRAGRTILDRSGNRSRLTTLYLPGHSSLAETEWPPRTRPRLLVELEMGSDVLPTGTVTTNTDLPVTVDGTVHRGGHGRPPRNELGRWTWSLVLPAVSLPFDSGDVDCGITVSGAELPEIHEYETASLDAYWTGRATLLERLATP